MRTALGMDPYLVAELFLGLLMAMAILAAVARRIQIPYPVLFVLGGFLLGLVPGIPELTLPPDLILLVFVPPLIYFGSVLTSPVELRANIWPIAQLAFGLVIATTAIVAIVAGVAIPPLTGSTALVLGALVASTDVTAVLAITERLPIPTRAKTVIDAESLFNDATSLVIYQIAVAAVVAGSFSLPEATLRFLAAGFGGTAIGLAVGWVMAWLRRFVADPLAELTLSVVTPFVAWIPAQDLGFSGAVAVATAGLFIGWGRVREFPAATRVLGYDFWQVFTFLLEGILFILTGLHLKAALADIGDTPLGLVLWYATIVGLTVICVRAVWVFATTLLRYWISPLRSRPGYRPDWKTVAVVAWSGMRGGEALAPALALPLVLPEGGPFPASGLLIFLTMGVIFFTLVLQGLTLPLLIRQVAPRAMEAATRGEALARREAARAALARLSELEREPWVPKDSVRRMRGRFEHTLQDVSAEVDRAHLARDEAHHRMTMEVLEARRREIRRLRQQGTVSNEVLRELERELDLEELQLTSEFPPPTTDTGPD